MSTKKIYVAPTMEAVKIDSVTLLAGSGELGLGGFVNPRGDLEDPEAGYDNP